LDLYAALSTFVSTAPKLINGICDAAQAGNLAEMEELATKLISYSNQAQLVSFTEKVKNLIIAAREQKPSTMENEIDSIREYFEQMAEKIDSIIPVKKIELNSFSAIK
jgi:hypothetical protein